MALSSTECTAPSTGSNVPAAVGRCSVTTAFEAGCRWLRGVGFATRIDACQSLACVSTDGPIAGFADDDRESTFPMSMNGETIASRSRRKGGDHCPATATCRCVNATNTQAVELLRIGGARWRASTVPQAWGNAARARLRADCVRRNPRTRRC